MKMIRKFIIACAVILIAASAFARDDSNTAHQIPVGNAHMLPNLQTFLGTEAATRALEDGLANFVDNVAPDSIANACLGVAGAGLTMNLGACLAYNAGLRSTCGVGNNLGLGPTGIVPASSTPDCPGGNSITFPNSSTCWVAMDENTTGNNAGIPTFTRVTGTHYLTDCASALTPTMAYDTQLLMRVTTAGGSITVVNDLRNFSPFTPPINGADVFVHSITGIGTHPFITNMSVNDVIDPTAYGAKFDLRSVADAMTTASSTTMTSATAAFCNGSNVPCAAGKSSDVGKTIIIMGAGGFPQWPGSGATLPLHTAYTTADPTGTLWWRQVTKAGVAAATEPKGAIATTSTDVAVTIDTGPDYVGGTNIFQTKYTTAGAVNWLTNGFVVNDWVNVSGYSNPGNNGQFRVVSVTATVLTVINTHGVAEGAGPTITISGAPGPGITLTDGTATETQMGRVPPFWQANQARYSQVGSQVVVRISGVDYLMQVTTGGTSGSVPPTWATTCPAQGDTCSDGATLVWTNEGPATLAGFKTTIASVSDASTVILTAAPTHTVSNATAVIGTNDLVAINNAIVAAVGSHDGRVQFPQGGTLIDGGPILFDATTVNFGAAVTMMGMGGGSDLNGNTPGSVIYSANAAGVPAIQVTKGNGVVLQGFRVTADPGHAGWAGIEFNSGGNVPIGAGGSRVQDVTIGGISLNIGNDIGWTGLDQWQAGRSFLAGMAWGPLLGGNCAGGNDRHYIGPRVAINGAGIGLYTPCIQAGENMAVNTQINFTERAVMMAAAWLMEGMQFNESSINIEMLNGGRLTCNFCVSESSQLHAYLQVNNTLTMTGGSLSYANTSGHTPLDPSGVIINARSASNVIDLKDMSFSITPGLGVSDPNAPQAIIMLGAPGTSNPESAVFQKNLGLYTRNIYDTSTTNFAHDIYWCPPSSDGNKNFEAPCSHNLFGSGTANPWDPYSHEAPVLHSAGLNLTTLATPVTPTVVPTGTTGATTYGYKIVARNIDGSSIAGPEGTTTVGNASLVTSPNQVSWNEGSPGVEFYDVYRTTGGATQGKIGSIAPDTVLSGKVQFFDANLTGDGTSAPTVNTTGTIHLGLPVAVPTAQSTAVIGCPTGTGFHGWAKMFDSTGTLMYMPTCQ
jgi:hypothetical protein